MDAGIAVTFTEEAAILVEFVMNPGDEETLIDAAVIEEESC